MKEEDKPVFDEIERELFLDIESSEDFVFSNMKKGFSSWKEFVGSNEQYVFSFIRGHGNETYKELTNRIEISEDADFIIIVKAKK